MFYNYISFTLMLLAIMFLGMCSTPLETLCILWEKEICPRMNEYLNIDPLTRPVSAFMVPIVFIVIFSLLFSGFLPYSAEFLMDPWMVFFLSLSCWFSAFLHMISVKRFSLYIVKVGHPRTLSFFMFLIELVSEAVKPFSLGIRLYANIVFGHYLLLGVWMVLSKLGSWSYVLSLPFVVFELAVFLVQSYIFAFLVGMYYAE